MGKIVLAFMFMWFLYDNMISQQVEITITNIRNSKGVIRIGIFKDQESFDKETPYDGKIFPKKSVLNGKLVVKFDLPPGKYGFAVLDDENEDGKMNYNLLGVPKEGYGFSGNTFFLSKPSFSEFAVNIRKGLNKFTIEMNYVF
ncbi:MAG: DUF2141 domain-containing protein [Bacteroidales bacterium]|nr:DUF2141 domain-containing protein [Bacteroidales bacterium]